MVVALRFTTESFREAIFEFFRLFETSSVEVKKSLTFLLVLFNYAPGRRWKVAGLNSLGIKVSYPKAEKLVLFASRVMAWLA